MNSGELAVLAVGVGLAGLYLVMGGGGAVAPVSGPRGIRNHNPGNIEYSPHNDWQGQTGTDGRFAIFSDPKWGLRAMAYLLRDDIEADRHTIRLLIEEWAPASENHTANYVAYVSDRAGIPADARLSVSDLPPIMAAMIQFENGEQPYSMAQIHEGVSLA